MPNDDRQPIPLVDLVRQHAGLADEIAAAMRDVANNAAFIGGPAVGEFEERFAERHAMGHAIAVASGTDALSLAVRALGIGPGDEVITVPNTWISTAFAISHSGAAPVFADIDPDTYQMDPEALEKAIGPRTKAVIAVHLFGHPAPMGAIKAICQSRGVRIIEDVAQAIGARTAGETVGTIGDLATYSFYPSKNLGAYGDGGLVLTDDGELAANVRRLANYGQNGAHRHHAIGYNSRLDTIQAAILLCKLPHLKEWTDARRRAATLYDGQLAGMDVKRPATAPGAEPVYHLYVIQVDERDACLAFLRDNGVMAQIHYPAVIHLQECYRGLGYQEGDLPVAETACQRILSLPIFPEITGEQIGRVVQTLARFIKR